MDYIGKTCPYCKTEFKDGDDIVVCSVCEMPHHKECWIENKSCTTFGCTGTIAGIDETTTTVNPTYCSKCGASINEGQKFCASCGTPVLDISNPPFQSIGTYTTNLGQQQTTYTVSQASPLPYSNVNYSTYGQPQPTQQFDQDLFVFLQTNQPAYISKFQKMQIANSNVSWNWCSFLFGSNWFAYRKMYGIAAAFLGISLVVGLIPGLGWFLQLALWVCSGIFGNYFYKQYVDSELQIAKSMDDFNKATYIAKKGGTSIGSVFACLGIAFVFSLIISNL